VNKPADKVIAEALSLSQADRERLIGELLTSLGPRDGDVDVDDAAAAELQERVDAVRSGLVKPLGVDEVFDRIEQRLTKKPT
jgi:putative addiction module component (TIGR02574 family)